MMNKLIKLPPLVYLTMMVLTIDVDYVSGIVDYGMNNGANSLLTLSDDNSSTPPGCDKPEYVSCARVRVNWDILTMDNDVLLPTG